jgi:hypothetical protein
MLELSATLAKRLRGELASMPLETSRLAAMTHHAAPEDLAVEIKSTAERFPLPSRDVADRLVELLVPVDEAVSRRDGAA